jgi:hypothetical protein
LSWSFAYAGPAADAEKLLAPFNKIGSISEESGDIPYPDIPSIQGTGLESDACQPNRTYALSTAGTQVYNLTTERQIYDAFNAKIAQYPELVLSARVTHEGYSNKAVRSVDPASSAFPLREDFHLLYVLPSLYFETTPVISTSISFIGVIIDKCSIKVHRSCDTHWSRQRGDRMGT